MRSCIVVPRLFLPKQNFEKWAVPPCSEGAQDPFFWDRIARGAEVSALSCILPDARLGEENEARFSALRDAHYGALETGAVERLYRGGVLVERHTPAGIRAGILLAVDLEEFSGTAEKDAAIRASEETDPALVKARTEARGQSLLEFPHTVLFYRDKKDKILRSMESDLEELYDFSLMEGGGRITGRFLPEYITADVAHDLMGRADPCFIVASGNHSLCAAKRHWENVRCSLTAPAQRYHPARFALAEFVNIESEAVSFEPIHRRVSGVDAEAFASFFEKKLKCKRSGAVLYPVLSAGPEGYRRVEETIGEYLAANGGKVERLPGKMGELLKEGSAVVALPPVGKEELLAAAKAGKRFPVRTFRLACERYCLEGREISYD